MAKHKNGQRCARTVRPPDLRTPGTSNRSEFRDKRTRNDEFARLKRNPRNRSCSPSHTHIVGQRNVLVRCFSSSCVRVIFSVRTRRAWRQQDCIVSTTEWLFVVELLTISSMLIGRIDVCPSSVTELCNAFSRCTPKTRGRYSLFKLIVAFIMTVHIAQSKMFGEPTVTMHAS